MLIKLHKSSSEGEINHISHLINEHSLRHLPCLQNKHIAVGDQMPDALLKELMETEAVEKIEKIEKPYKLASREFKPQNTVINICGVKIGGKEIALMAGPCAIESIEQLIETGLLLKKSGVKILRASAYKPRTSPYSFQGHGEEGLKMHKEAKKHHGLLIETEVMDVRDVHIAAKYADILRVGARNMQNFDLLKELGRCGKPVILKRGMSSTVEEWLMSAEYIMAHGNPDVILCERGIRTFENSTRNTLDLSSVAVAKTLTHLPIIVDPSHAAGRKDILEPLSLASIAVGADGLLIEVHHRPEVSMCDRDQALSPEEFHKIALRVQLIAEAEGRVVDLS
ncbi:MAG: Phospho-2-dehydro-3-deoxyheptonate aldolase [Chlamydiia bacterium]|nr:Phospho-2-dehydro-3-deoxyheptonate aldolase [Chlamydiia bacterium]